MLELFLTQFGEMIKGFNINVKLNEGKKYYIGDVNFIGNTLFYRSFTKTIRLSRKGEIYDAVGFNKKVGEDGKEDDTDIKSLYLNNDIYFQCNSCRKKL